MRFILIQGFIHSYILGEEREGSELILGDKEEDDYLILGDRKMEMGKFLEMS